MIQMTNGTFGLRVGKIVVGKTKDDEPFETDAKTEARLVKAGLAKYVDVTSTEVDTEQSAEMTYEYLDDMNMSQLREIASDLGLKQRVGMKKAELIEMILDHGEPEEVESDEPVPEFNPEDAVQ